MLNRTTNCRVKPVYTATQPEHPPFTTRRRTIVFRQRSGCSASPSRSEDSLIPDISSSDVFRVDCVGCDLDTGVGQHS